MRKGAWGYGFSKCTEEESKPWPRQNAQAVQRQTYKMVAPTNYVLTNEHTRHGSRIQNELRNGKKVQSGKNMILTLALKGILKCRTVAFSDDTR